MPNIFTAKKIAEEALRVIGRLAPKRQADAADLAVALTQLEMALNDAIGRRAISGLSYTFDIPLVEGVTTYATADYANTDEVQQVFSIFLVEPSTDTDPQPVIMRYESEGQARSQNHTGTPCECVVSRDVLPIITLLQKPSAGDVEAGRVLRLRVQTYSKGVDPRGIADSDVSIRPSWYLWAVTRTAYLCGRGPVLRLPNNELSVLRQDAVDLETPLLARDGLSNTNNPPITEPYDF